MKCIKCETEIVDGSKFCPECGLSQNAANPGIDQSDLLRKYIPPELAKRILSAGKQIESERRLVTVVFADVSGFTAMSEKLDAEDVAAVINDCFKGLISIVYKYEGVIDKFIGDEIMAIFGAPLAHENDAERAVRCAVEMQEFMHQFNALSPILLPVPLGLHIGINTGLVVAGNVGSDLRMNYSVLGDTVNLASRIEHIAEKGEVVISDDTYRIVSSLINVEEPKMVEVKGKMEPVRTFKILSAKSEIEPGTRALLECTIVGRYNEIVMLKEAIERVVGKREQRLFIRGEAGVGKTRLKMELIRLSKSGGVTIFEGKCSSFEINTPYYLWTTLLKNILSLGPAASENETRKHLHDILQILSLENDEPYLATLLSLRYEEILMEEDQERRRRIYGAVRELLRTLAKRRPTMFLFEDVHWIDKFSQELLSFLYAEQELAPAMFVPIFRDEYRHSKDLMEKGGVLIDLNRLSLDDALKLMCLRLEADEVPANLADAIYRRSEGNPFFIEELIKTLVDKEVVRIKKRKIEILRSDIESALPATVQGVIMARIDRLEEKLKDVLFSASVIGREFNKTILQEVLKHKSEIDPSLNELKSLELILEQQEVKEFAYLFKHYLIQEVAYNTILQKKRKELHKLIAQTIEKLYPDKLKEFYELLAFHYEKAEEWDKAADYLGRAGRKVGEIFSKEESIEFSQRKVAAIQKLFESSGERRMGWSIAGVLIASVSFLFFVLTLLPTVMIWGALLLWVTHVYINFDMITFVRFFFVLFVMPWITAVLFFYGVLPAMRGRPKVIELLEDRIVIHFKGGRIFDVQFSEIASIRFFDHKDKSLRPLKYRILDPFHRIQDYSKFGFLQWINDVVLGMIPPFFFGFGSKKGEIIIERKMGWNKLRLFIPWLNTRKKSLSVSLTPSDPQEYYQQLLVAYAKWMKVQSVKR
jgi:class 3 adenylate cyclase